LADRAHLRHQRALGRARLHGERRFVGAVAQGPSARRAARVVALSRARHGAMRNRVDGRDRRAGHGLLSQRRRAGVTARIYYAACAALIGYALAYTLPIYGRLPHTFYDPVARRWFFAANATPIPMGYIGQIVWGIAGALIAAGITMVMTARR